MRPRTEKEALDQCKLLWEELAAAAGGLDEKFKVAERVLGYRPLHACPACAWDDRVFVGFICGACPIKAWRRTDKNDAPNKCCDVSSPYHWWTISRNVSDCEEYARRIIKLIEESRNAEVSGAPQDY